MYISKNILFDYRRDEYEIGRTGKKQSGSRNDVYISRYNGKLICLEDSNIDHSIDFSLMKNDET